MDFDTWLSQRLLDLKTDEAVFGPYIKSILEEGEDDKIEDLDGILSELGLSSLDVESLRSEILSRWDAHVNKGAMKGGGDMAQVTESKGFDKSPENVDAGPSSLDKQFEELMKLSPKELGEGSSSNKTKDSAPDSELRAAILKQYQEVDGDSDEEEAGVRPKRELDGLSKNTNAERVLNAQKELRETAKADAAKKREKDREDRARQKKLAEDKKAKAKQKTAKVERKR